MHAQHHSQVKVVGSNGQLSLGKEYAGKMVIIDQIDEGTWMIKAGVFLPDNERWLYQKGQMDKLDKAISWAEENEPKDNFEKFSKEQDK